ncbi:MAG: S8 family serine peptidase [Spirochaetales bacterium]|nr:S8 family serine peptidase [Spirochaetales bacterium]
MADTSPLSIAVIDNGVHEEYLKKQQPVSHLIRMTHGTICAGIIKKYAPEAPLIDIKILNARGKGSRQQLCRAILYCIRKKIRIINLSNGSTHFHDEPGIKDVMLRAYAHNIIIVSAFSNENHYTYPASFSFVIGVKCDRKDLSVGPEYSFHLFAPDGIEITTSGTESLFDGERYRSFGPSNSYAAPKITALVFQMLLENPHRGFADVRYELWKRSKNRAAGYQYFSNTIDWTKQAYYISLGDHNRHSINKNHIPFQLKRIINLECNDTKTFSEQLKIRMHKDRNILSKVDTVVIINNREKTGISPYSLVAGLQKTKKHIVYLDRPFDAGNQPVLSPDYHIRVCCLTGFSSPCMDPGPEEIPVPVIGFFDSMKSRGISLLMRLIRLFRKKGYYAIGLSPYETSILYGLNCFFNDTGSDTPGKSIHSCYMLYNPDLIFVHIPMDNMLPVELNKYKFDLSINLSENHIKKQEDMFSPGNSTILTISRLQSKRIYQRIIHWFKQ